MHINIEAGEATRIYVHDICPEIIDLVHDNKQPFYILRNAADEPCLLTVFLKPADLQALYEQLKEILEPSTAPQESASTCLTT